MDWNESYSVQKIFKLDNFSEYSNGVKDEQLDPSLYVLFNRRLKFKKFFAYKPQSSNLRIRLRYSIICILLRLKFQMIGSYTIARLYSRYCIGNTLGIPTSAASLSYVIVNQLTWYTAGTLPKWFTLVEKRRRRTSNQNL